MPMDLEIRAHIDYNCDNIVLQYNISAYNAGGFKYLNNYNCMYRYNLSINDGHLYKRILMVPFKKEGNFMVKRFQGEKKRKGRPVNSYFIITPFTQTLQWYLK
jgi:hypothetical protein